MAELQTKAEPASVPAPATVEPQLAEALDSASKKATAAVPAPVAAETKALAVVEKEKESESEFLFFRWSKFQTFAFSESWVVVKIQLLPLHDEKRDAKMKEPE